MLYMKPCYRYGGQSSVVLQEYPKSNQRDKRVIRLCYCALAAVEWSKAHIMKDFAEGVLKKGKAGEKMLLMSCPEHRHTHQPSKSST